MWWTFKEKTIDVFEIFGKKLLKTLDKPIKISPHFVNANYTHTPIAWWNQFSTALFIWISSAWLYLVATWQIKHPQISVDVVLKSLRYQTKIKQTLYAVKIIIPQNIKLLRGLAKITLKVSRQTVYNFNQKTTV